MDEPDRMAAGRAAVEHVFALTGRGLVVFIKEDGFTGAIPSNGVIQGERGESVFAGPGTGRRMSASGAPIFCVGVLAKAGNAAELFRPGDKVSFFAKP